MFRDEREYSNIRIFKYFSPRIYIRYSFEDKKIFRIYSIFVRGPKNILNIFDIRSKPKRHFEYIQYQFEYRIFYYTFNICLKPKKYLDNFISSKIKFWSFWDSLLETEINKLRKPGWYYTQLLQDKIDLKYIFFILSLFNNFLCILLFFRV